MVEDAARHVGTRYPSEFLAATPAALTQALRESSGEKPDEPERDTRDEFDGA